ncbi:SMI1/KNR4 family protein [Desmospora profundinema]|uniref:Cell wall assembly regulator SMI1 n=1 Tax=Desmospora profundinema TaxID=1571184 RepID=A0ABU1IN29_9BACL|nr:SMI1/KNR4 family protein [Desmospora profundinema]MDR6226171.1 cell wall assembly regulator SMI1 [Desmospora profundinema]
MNVYFDTSWVSKHSKPNLTEDEIKEVEAALGISFPKEYKKIVQKYNGALIEPNVIDFNDEEEVFEMLIDLLPNQEFNIVSTVKAFQKRERLPEKVIPIATDPGGNYFCYDFRISESHPPIVFYDHEFEWDDDNLTYVRPNLTELLNDLRD